MSVFDIPHSIKISDQSFWSSFDLIKINSWWTEDIAKSKYHRENENWKLTETQWSKFHFVIISEFEFFEIVAALDDDDNDMNFVNNCDIRKFLTWKVRIEYWKDWQELTRIDTNWHELNDNWYETNFLIGIMPDLSERVRRIANKK
jgi:hypothetical protein